MKKLLIFLGAIGLTAASSVAVVSCKTKNNNPSNPDKNAVNNIADLKKAFETVNSNVTTAKDNVLKMTRIYKEEEEEEEANYKIFNFEFLKSQDWSGSNILDWTIAGEYEKDLINDLNQFFPKSQYLEQIKKQIESNNEFQHYINLGQEDGGFSFPAGSSVELTRTMIKDGDNIEPIYNVKFNFNKIFFFLDKDGTKTPYTISGQKLVALVGKDGPILSIAADISQNAGDEIYTKFTSTLDYETLKGNNFKRYGEISTPLFKQINEKDDIKKILNEIIKSSKRAEEFNLRLNEKSKLISDASLVKSDSTLFNFGTAANIAVEGKNNANLARNPILKNLLLKKHDNSDKDWITSEDSDKAFREIIHKFKDTTDNFRTNISEWFKKDGYGLDPNTIDTYKNNAYSYGSASLDGISLSVTDGHEERDIQIPAINTHWVYCVENEESTKTYLNYLTESFKAINKHFLWNSYDKKAKDLLTASPELTKEIINSITNVDKAPPTTDQDALALKTLSERIKKYKSDSLSTSDTNNGKGGYSFADFDSSTWTTTLARNDGEVAKSLEEDEQYQFNSFSATFYSYPGNGIGIMDTRVNWTPDGRIGFKPIDKNQYGTYDQANFVIKITLDNIQFRFSLPSDLGNGADDYNGADIADNYKDEFFVDSESYQTGSEWYKKHWNDYNYDIFNFGTVKHETK